MLSKPIEQAQSLANRIQRAYDHGGALRDLPADLKVSTDEMSAWMSGTHLLLVEVFGAESDMLVRWNQLKADRERAYAAWVRENPGAEASSVRGLEPYIHELRAYIAFLETAAPLATVRQEKTQAAADAEHNANKPPMSLAEGAWKVFWPKHKLGRVAVVALAAVGVLSFTVWMSLSDKMKGEVAAGLGWRSPEAEVATNRARWEAAWHAALEVEAVGQLSGPTGTSTNREKLLDVLRDVDVQMDSALNAAKDSVLRAVVAGRARTRDPYYNLDFPPALQRQVAGFVRRVKMAAIQHGVSVTPAGAPRAP